MDKNIEGRKAVLNSYFSIFSYLYKLNQKRITTMKKLLIITALLPLVASAQNHRSRMRGEAFQTETPCSSSVPSHELLTIGRS